MDDGSGGQVRLRLELEATGGNTTGFRIDEAVVAGFGSRRPKVLVTIGRHSWRSSITSMGGAFWLGGSAANRAAAGIAAGDVVGVALEADTAPRTVEVPDDLAAALAAEPGLREAFDALSFSHQRQHVEAILAAKQPDTRTRRIAACLAQLRGS